MPKKRKQPRKPRPSDVPRPRRSSGGAPPAVHAAAERIRQAWDRAVVVGLMDADAETKYHMLADGQVLSVAVGRNGRILANGQELTPEFAGELRCSLPDLALMVTFYERNQERGFGLAGAPEDGPTLLPTSPAASSP